MKQIDLMQRLWEITQKAEQSAEVTPFRQDIQDLYISLRELIMDLSLEWLEIQDFVENEIQFCWHCHQKISLHKKRIDKWMVTALIKVFNFVMKNKRQYFQIQEIWLNPVEYGSLNHLVRFWLLYKSWDLKRWEYGIPRKTVSKFLAWEWSVAEFYETNPTKKEWEKGRREMSENRITINQIPSISELRKKFGEKLTEYSWNEEFE